MSFIECARAQWVHFNKQLRMEAYQWVTCEHLYKMCHSKSIKEIDRLTRAFCQFLRLQFHCFVSSLNEYVLDAAKRILVCKTNKTITSVYSCNHGQSKKQKIHLTHPHAFKHLFRKKASNTCLINWRPARSSYMHERAIKNTERRLGWQKCEGGRIGAYTSANRCAVYSNVFRSAKACEVAGWTLLSPQSTRVIFQVWVDDTKSPVFVQTFRHR